MGGVTFKLGEESFQGRLGVVSDKRSSHGPESISHRGTYLKRGLVGIAVTSEYYVLSLLWLFALL